MSELSITLAGDRSSFAPGESLRGVAAWRLDAPEQAGEIRLLWFTRGKGAPDFNLVAGQRLEALPPTGRQEFRFDLPNAPYSFSGKLVSLSWAVELVTEPSRFRCRRDFILSPTGNEIDLCAERGPTPANELRDVLLQARDLLRTWKRR